MKIKNKIIFILLLFLLILLTFNINNVFASVPTDSSNAYIILNKVEEYFDSHNLVLYDYIICNDGLVYAFCQEDYDHTVNNWAGGYRIYCNKAYIFEFDTNYNYTFPVKEGPCSFCDYGLVDTVIYSTFNIVNREGTVFFMLTPVPTETQTAETPVLEIQAVEIPALETAEQIPQAMGLTLKIVIPVGLVVLAIGLIIYLIKRVIYLHQ